MAGCRGNSVLLPPVGASPEEGSGHRYFDLAGLLCYSGGGLVYRICPVCPRVHGLPEDNPEGTCWVTYDSCYRRQAALNKDLSWSRRDPDLYQEAFTGRARAVSRCAPCLSWEHASSFCHLAHLRATGLSPVLVQARPHLLATKSYMSSCAVCITGGRGTLVGSNRASMSTLVRHVCFGAMCAQHKAPPKNFFRTAW